MSFHDRGLTNYHAGLAAEDVVCREYCEAGYSAAARRWRGRGGEIDLIFRRGAEVIFVEVKKSRDCFRAAESLTRRQIGRISAAAEEFLAREPQGLLTPARIDAAFVDSHGRTAVVENITMG
ncbi:hypothetical protein GQ651_12320 [Alphaproteobacteria bacterium GH1-50]|uniref:UPF0102 protein GQ651_12320 n=1 Tax=Kangsaoukella pontilimi TaxID=2691042 RepID=A0A7C9MF20_9RHOB|nr:YraN family protein [Kangsaoukella pontilimi]MXQ08632.1 hypothetical protein [Kangsaoukella pontilimi]